MRTIHIEIVCDQCDEDCTEGHVENLEVKHRGKTYEVDLCHECIDRLVESGRILPAAKARGQKRELIDDPSLDCDHPGCDFSGKTARGLAIHKKRQGHG